MPSCLRNILFLLDLFVISGTALQLNYSGEAVTTRFWDCCKPSCAWKDKAAFSRPVLSCTADDKSTEIDAGTGCNGGTGFQCSNQQPWSVNDTFSYGFAGVYIKPELTGGKIEDAWCCACYQLDFTSEPLRGKSMIIQASNTAYDVKTDNRFSLAVPGGNTTSHDGCARQYGVDQSVFGAENAGISASDDCDKLPEALKAGCKWRFDWFKDASYPSANFKRVACPSALTDLTQCTRNDDKEVLTGQDSPASTFSPSTKFAALAIGLASLFSV
ncbi:glycoside hydrolase family 45 protein [Lentithecium fluviatile CBS 122367]|uniref:cellulase n=1 Tax=Lentithecium fluviatile CBS 122367 TaxID=1168545 RepID=A0A6G1JF57_9PLEO|nr:glycoside hydrolase family 45 protein [Lentithecium fluviatile CBS 122367]